MKKQVEIKRVEVIDLMGRNHRYSILKTLQNIVDNNPDRISEFGFKIEDFNVSDELKKAEEHCNQWWVEISKKYDLPLCCRYRVRFDSNMVTIE